MGFLSPWFLAGIAAVGLPIWIHLLRKYHSTPQPFSSLMFFENRPQSAVRQRRRLRYLLLFALRVALLVLLALAFAQPYILSPALKASSQKLRVIAIDRSFSMRAGTDNQSRLDQAKAQARDFISRLLPGDRAQIMAFDSQVQHLTAATSDQSELVSAIEGISPSDERSSFGELSRAIRALAQSAKTPLEVHLFSDLQQSSAPPSFTDLDPGSQATVQLHQIDATPIPNWAVASVEAPAYIWESKPVTIATTLAAWNAKDASQKKVTLIVDGRTVESKQVNVLANERPRVEFHFEPGHGRHQAEIRLEPHDRLPQDDRLLFALEHSEPEKILFLQRGGSTRSGLYYRAAIESARQSHFVVETKPVEQADGLPLASYAIVVLSDTGKLSKNFEVTLRSYITNGGGLLILAGQESALLGQLPVTNTDIRPANRSGSEQVVMKAEGQHPALQHTNGLSGVVFSQLTQLDAKNAQVLARTENGAPALLEHSVGGGRVLILASALDRTGTNLPLHPAFVPFIQDSALYLAGEEIAKTNVTVGAASELRRSPQQKGSVGVLGPEGKPLIPLERASSEQTFRFNREGYYEVHKADGRRQLIAVNADREESNLAPIAPELISLWQKAGASSAASASSALTPATQPLSFWRFVLLLALLAAIVESLVSARHLTTSQEAS